MSTPHAGNAGSRDLSLRPRPEGWPVGSFDSYADAQAAVDMLSDKSDFPSLNSPLLVLTSWKWNTLLGA